MTRLPKLKEMHLNSGLNTVTLWCFLVGSRSLPRLILVKFVSLVQMDPSSEAEPVRNQEGFLEAFLDGKFWSLRGRGRKRTSVAETHIVVVLSKKLVLCM